MKINGTENIPIDRPILYISNHNVGALLESHSSLFIINKITNPKFVFGFTHPSIFRIPLIKQYFELIGAVPATYEIAEQVFKSGNSLMIFPGGNSQALRPIFEYKNNSFRNSHGWAKIAKENNIDVIPITFKGSHFLNPILISSQWVSKLLILPWFLGMKVASISLAQILFAILTFRLTNSYVLTYIVFILSPISIILPYPVTMKIHKIISNNLSQDEIENKVNKVMDDIYK